MITELLGFFIAIYYLKRFSFIPAFQLDFLLTQLDVSNERVNVTFAQIRGEIRISLALGKHD